MNTATGVSTLHYIRRLVRDLAPAPDRDVVQNFIEHSDEAAFATLVERHGPMVLGVCQAVLHHRHDAEDAFQATFLVLARRAGSIRRRDGIGSWLHGVACRVACKARAVDRRRKQIESRATAATHQPAADDITWAELRAVLHTELAKLPARLREPLVLCYLEGLTQDEAARRLGWPASTVKGRLQRGRERLRCRLERRGFGLTAVLGAALTSQNLAAPVSVTLIDRSLQIIFRPTPDAVSLAPVLLAQRALAPIVSAKLRVLTALMLLGTALASGLALVQSKPTKEPPIPQAATAKPAPRTDRYGDPLPEGATARLGTMRYRTVPPLGSAPAWASAFDGEGKTFVVGSEGGVDQCDIRTGRLLRRFATPERVHQAAISPNGKIIAAGPDAKEHLIRIWKAATGKEIYRFKVEEARRGNTLLFSPDSKRLASNFGAGAPVLWDLMTGKEIWKHAPAEDKSVSFLPQAFSTAGDALIGTEMKRGSESGLVFLDTATGREVRRIAGFSSYSDLTFSRDRKLLAMPVQGWVLQIWDLAAGKKLRDIRGLRSSGEHFAFSRDGKTLAWSSEDKCIRLLDVATGNEVRRVAKGLGTANRLVFLSDNKTLAFCLWNENTLRVWDLEHDRELYPLDGHRGRVFDALYSPEGRTIISAGMDGTIRHWDPRSGKELNCTEAHSGGAWCLALTPDGKTLASASLNDKMVRLWDNAARKEIGRVAPPNGALSLAITPDGKLLLTATEGPEQDRLPFERANALRVWDVASGKELRHWVAHNAQCPVALSSDGKLVASENAGSILVWDLFTGSQQRDMPVPKSSSRVKVTDWESINALAFSPDGRILVGAKRDGSVKNPHSAIVFWELASGKVRMSIELAPAWGRILSFSPDGRYLAVGGFDQKVHVLDTSTGEIIRQFEGHHGEITSVTFAPDGKTIATGSTDTTILVWDVADLARRKQKPAVELSAKEIVALWNDLAEADAAKAYRAIVKMSIASNTVTYLARRLRPIAPADPARLAKLIAHLDDQQFTKREKATEELANLNDLAEQALRKALTTNPSQEVRRRAAIILQKLETPITSVETLRGLRAVEVLERADNREAREVLTTLASGAPGAWLTQQAQAARNRVVQQAHRRGNMP